MLTIRRAQIDTFLQGDPERFIDQILRHVLDTMPDEVRGIPVNLVKEMISVGVKRARGHGLTTDEQIVSFVSVMFEIAPNFDTESTLQAVLSDTRLTPVERWESLFTDTPALRAAWERAAHPDFYDPKAWIGPSLDDQAAI